MRPEPVAKFSKNHGNNYPNNVIPAKDLKDMNAKVPNVLLFAKIIALAVATSGCGKGNGPPTFPVSGRVILERIEPDVLSGHTIEFSLDSNPAVRSFAEIQSDGSFDLSTLHKGFVYPGAREGVYKVRLVLSDDDPEARNRLATAIEPSSLSLAKTPWVVQVPTKEPVRISLKRR